MHANKSRESSRLLLGFWAAWPLKVFVFTKAGITPHHKAGTSRLRHILTLEGKLLSSCCFPLEPDTYYQGRQILVN
jgi:hypothetical protein